MRASRALANAVDDVAEAIAGAGVTLPANWRDATTLEEMLDGARGIHPAADALEDLIDFAKAGAPN